MGTYGMALFAIVWCISILHDRHEKKITRRVNELAKKLAERMYYERLNEEREKRKTDDK